jgi:hypothetical protein
MILVAKSAAPPAALRAGEALTQALCATYDLHPALYRNGVKKQSFRRAAYGASRIKQALSRDQHGKCCYCEARFSHVYKGDVEHYRPKGPVSVGGEEAIPWVLLASI